MRISTSQIHQSAVAAMLEQQTKLSYTQQQLSTGKRILTPSDDPSAAAKIITLNKSIDSTTQYQINIEAARSRLTTEESALAGVGDILQRVRELGVQAGGNQSATVRQAMAVEVRQLAVQMRGLANTKDSNGEYLFAGFRSGATPFTDNGGGTIVYNGDQGVRQVQIGPDRHIEVGDSGASVFMNLPAGAGGVQDMFAMLNNFANNLDANTTDPNTIADIDTAMKSVLATRARVGARLNALDSQTGVNESYLLQVQSTLSTVQDLDYAEAISRFNRQALALQAAQDSYAKIQGLSLFNYLR